MSSDEEAAVTGQTPLGLDQHLENYCVLYEVFVWYKHSVSQFKGALLSLAPKLPQGEYCRRSDRYAS